MLTKTIDANMGEGQESEWEIPDRDASEFAFSTALDKFTDIDLGCAQVIEFSSMGWNTGVGLISVRSDKLQEVNIFRDILRATSSRPFREKCY